MKLVIKILILISILFSKEANGRIFDHCSIESTPTTSIEHTISESPSEDLKLVRSKQKHYRERLQLKGEKFDIIDLRSLYACENSKVYTYPFDSSCKQSVCYGLLYLQALF